MTGTLINERYLLENELGRGGMGIIYNAHDNLLERQVAVKVLSDSSLGSHGRARLLHEAQAAARLNHPNIVSVYDAGEIHSTTDNFALGLPFIVMEFVEGQSLYQRNSNGNRPLDLDEILLIALQICAALEHAHSHGIIHRDLKPENVLLTPDGTVKLMDFGLARTASSRLSKEKALVGTVFYLAPEQALGQEVDGRTDLYALGVMLYELVTGKLPFSDDDPLQVINQHLHVDPQPPIQLNPTLPPALSGLILKLLAKDPAGRYATAGEVSHALSAILRAERNLPLSRPTNNLPIQLTSFIGREAEITRAKQYLTSTRLLTLTGVGGTGKSRLALQVAGQLLDGYPDGVWLVDLASILDPELVDQTAASILEIRPDAGSTCVLSMVKHLSTRRLLLIFDNCEHLLQPVTGLVETLLRSCPNIRIMATSREALGIPGETIMQVPSMALPDIKKLPSLEEAWQAESMRLFKDRALAIQPDFQPTDQNTVAVALICNRLDGIPLAIELAAARIRFMPVEEISARIDDRFRLLTGGSRSALPRQQTLQATIDWSYDLLSETERTLLRRLSVFVNGWTIEAAESICADAHLPSARVLDSLMRLVDKSLVIAKTRAGAARYRLLETIRQYGRDKLLDLGELEELRDRHLAFFLQFAEKAEPELWQSEQIKWLDCLDLEHDNLHSALEWSLTECRNLSSGLRLACALIFFWQSRGYWNEGRETLEALLQCDEAQQEPSIYWKSLCYLGYLTELQGNLNRAQVLFEKCFEASQKTGDELTHAYALLGLGSVAEEQETSDVARKLLGESLEILRKVGDKRGQLIALGRLMHIAYHQHDYASAKAYFDENLALCRKLGNRLALAGTLISQGWMYVDENKPEQARPLVEESLSIYRQSKDKSGIADALTAMGLLELYRSDFNSARPYYEESLRLSRELSDAPEVGIVLIGLGEVSRAQGDYQAAGAYYEECVSINRELGQVHLVAVALHNLGYVANFLGDYKKAIQYFSECMTIARQQQDLKFTALCLAGLAVVAVNTSHLARAARSFGAAQALFEKTGMSPDKVDQREIDRSMLSLRSRLDDSKFHKEWAKGHELTLEEMVDYAMEDY